MTKKKSKVKKESEFSGLSLDDLTDKKKEIKEFLASLENDYRNAVISEKSYKHTKEVNRKKMEDLKQQLEDFGITDSDDESENDSDKPSDDVKKETSETVPASPEPAQASQDAPPPSEQAQTPQNSEGAEKVEDVPPQSEPAQTPQGAESAEKVEDASTEDHKGSSFIDKLKQHMKPLTSSVSSEPAAPKTDAPSSNDTASKTTSSSQNVELLMQKFSEKINIDLERIKANIDSIKEAKSSTDEKLQSMTENLAELRTTVFQREAGLKEQELKFTKVKELVDDIEPEKINKQFMKRDKFMSEMEIRIEKLEVKMNDLIKTAKHTDDLLKSIGGLENVANINHDITKKMEHINEKGKSVDHIFSKIEKMFVDMNKNLDDFNIYQTRQDNMNDVLEDTLKNVDQLGVKFNSYIDKKDMKTMQNNMDALSEKIEVMMGILKKAVPFAEAEIPKDLQDLENQKEDIESLLSTLESEYKKKQISEIDYNKIKMKNEAYLDKIKEEISKIMKQIIKKESNGKSSKSETSETSENTETNDTTDKPTDT
ncbi:MAG: hypothetical protein KAJ20_00670, partial [Candidatus Aenigmarchaeota archaeon]|nr:hypothetical protein [Candidatus Aenigmarchaeota archaeon]